MLTFFTLIIAAVLIFVIAEEQKECDEMSSIDDAKHTGSCLASSVSIQDEIFLGLNALPARISVVSGQIQSPPTCGSWCATAPDPASPCKMDEDVVPCETDFYCTTTCALWSLNTSTEKRPKLSCSMFTRFDGYPFTHGAEPCDEACLLPEIRKERYPMPTGVGLLCQIGTCYPAVSSMTHLEEVAAALECPCNWFGADCPDDWAPVQAINHTAKYGDLVATTLSVNPENWKKIVENHQPGGVIRIVHRDPANPVSGRMHEQPYALAYAPSEGKLEILTAPPDMSLHPMPREVAERVRSLPSGPISGGNLFVNPSIAGFFNKEWGFLMDVIEGSRGGIDHLVILSTGAGLSGALSAVEATIDIPLGLKGIHLYHGLRSVQDLPYKERLNELVSSQSIDLAIIESSSSSGTLSSKSVSVEIAAAVQRGSSSVNLARVLADGKKAYVQHVVVADLMPNGGTLFEKGALLENTLFVACGRMALLEDSYRILRSTFCTTNEDNDYCENLLGRHFFTNI
jgi:hypothetical protein